MTTLGLIGSGLIGSGIARLAVAAGYDVVLSNSRGPDTLADLVAELGPKARAATPAEAAEAGDLVVVTVPLKAYREVPVEPLRGKVVIDTNNYYPQRDGQIPELDDESTTVSELLQAHLPESHVVKCFNNVPATGMVPLAKPAGDPDRSVLAIAGDDAGAKKTVTAVPRRDRLRRLRRRPAGRGLALPARHQGLRRLLPAGTAGQGGLAAQGPGGSGPLPRHVSRGSAGRSRVRTAPSAAGGP